MVNGWYSSGWGLHWTDLRRPGSPGPPEAGGERSSPPAGINN